MGPTFVLGQFFIHAGGFLSLIFRFLFPKNRISAEFDECDYPVLFFEILVKLTILSVDSVVFQQFLLYLISYNVKLYFSLARC